MIRCPAKDLVEFILPAIGTDKKTREKILMKDAALDTIFHRRVLAHGKTLAEVKENLRKHIPVCAKCTGIYDNYLEKEAAKSYGNHPQGRLEVDRDKLELYSKD